MFACKVSSKGFFELCQEIKKSTLLYIEKFGGFFLEKCVKLTIPTLQTVRGVVVLTIKSRPLCSSPRHRALSFEWRSGPVGQKWLKSETVKKIDKSLT